MTDRLLDMKRLILQNSYFESIQQRTTSQYMHMHLSVADQICHTKEASKSKHKQTQQLPRSIKDTMK